MSGGYFGYKQHYFNYIADEIKHIIETNDCTEKNEWGDDIGYHYPSNIIEEFTEAVCLLEKVRIMAQRIDWLLSGDDGEESFIKRWDEEIKSLKKEKLNDQSSIKENL